MKKLTLLALIVLAVAIATIDVDAQRSYRLRRPCDASTTPAKVELESDGDLNIIPCASQTVYINGTSIVFDLAGVTSINLQRTITAGGTTGNRTINLPAGTVNLAAAATSVTVTNSTVAATSIVFAIARTNDSTCAVKNVVPSAGSFVINMTAGCTAETSVGFLVTN